MRALRRRTFLSGLAASSAVLAAGPAAAIGARTEVGVGRLRHGAKFDRPEALRRLLWEVGKRTSIAAARDASIVALEPDGSAAADELFWQPLLVLAGEGELPRLDDRARGRLEKHLRFGGTLLVDAPSPDDPFARSARAQIEDVMATRFSPLPADHVVFKSFFLLDKAEGRTRADPQLHGISIGARAAVLLSHVDLLGAYERDRFGTWRFECAPDGERQRERAFRLGVNVVMYATCLDYKEDQVHVPFLMKKRRR